MREMLAELTRKPVRLACSTRASGTLETATAASIDHRLNSALPVQDYVHRIWSQRISDQKPAELAEIITRRVRSVRD